MADRLCKDDDDNDDDDDDDVVNDDDDDDDFFDKHNVDDDNVSIVVQLLKTMPMNCSICVQGVLHSVTAAAANGDYPIVAFQLLPMTTTPTIEYYVVYVCELIIC